MRSYNQEKKKNGPQNKRTKNGGRQNNGNRNRSAKRISKLDPQLLVKKAIAPQTNNYISERFISDLPINQVLVNNLLLKGFKRPTEIQDRSLDAGLQGNDILGIAQTGTGKTAAFLIPIIQDLLKNPGKKQFALILVPTRELALQVEQEFKSMSRKLNLHCSCFIGGTNINRDLDKLKRKPHVIIGTPGRLLDLNNRGVLNFSVFKTLVLDEFDRMLDMGFAKDVDRIINAISNRNQTMLFSATLDKTQLNKINEILTNPIKIKVSQGNTSNEHIEQKIIELGPDENKLQKLITMLNQDEFSKVLIFDETKHRVKRLCRQLNNVGIKSGQIQGNLSQNARQKALNEFKKGKIRVLVASDVAARGIDVNDISHVINYQLPMTYDTYIHRIGRTGRAGNTGVAYTFVS